ncbi:MAG: acyl-ACP--UDP-N-acetylglucosamine O-acyltransferase [Oligoflexia bacterium]|nr:acyl-ACP--UDP-N-acetylglucosamine O-acyltransferase [Oligoflexia bacterium]
MSIHKTAIIEDGAVLGDNVSVGAYAIIGPNVKLGNNCKVEAHAILDGHLSAGENNTFSSFTSIGHPPQDLSYKGEPTEVIIGDNNIFREYVSIHRGTMKEEGKTIVGSDNLFMSYVHLGHDVQFGSNCVIANSTNLAGHVRVGDRVIIGGGTNISQFVSIGRGAYLGGASAVDRDVPLFCTAYGNRVRLKGINIIGLRRQGYEKQVITEVVDFYRLMEASPLSPRAYIDHEEYMEEFKDNQIIKEMSDGIRGSEVGIAPFMS